MPTVVNKLVAYTGGDYTSLNAALAATPANLVTADEQWNITIGESAAGVYEWTISVDNIFGSRTTDATRYITLSAQAGKSFKNNANKLTNALRYNGANGVALNIGGGRYFTLPSFTRVSNLQIKGGFQVNFGENHKLNDCIISQRSDPSNNQHSTWTNVLYTTEANSPFLNTGGANRTREFHNCHFFAFQPGANSDWVTNFYCTFILKNCTFFGFNTFEGTGGSGAGSHTYTTCVNNATSLSSFPAGFSSSVLSLTASSQFENVTAGSEDFRVKAGAGLINAGVRDQIYTNDLDIVGVNRRLTTPTIGVWEYYIYARPASDITTQWTASTTGAVGSWTRIVGSAGQAYISSNALAMVGTTQTFYAATDNATPDHYASAVVGNGHRSGSGANIFSLVVRATNTTNCIAYAFEVNTTTHRIYTIVGGTYTVIGSSVSALAAGDTIKLEAIGNSITCYKNGSAIIGPITSTFNNSVTTCGVFSRFTAATDVLQSFESGPIGAYYTRDNFVDITGTALESHTPTWSGVPHYSLINEATYNDTNYIYSTASSQTDEVKLQTMSTPLAGSSVNINYRIQGVASGAAVTVSLYCGAVPIKTDITRNADSSTFYTMTVLPTEWAFVTDWTNMRIRFVSS